MPGLVPGIHAVTQRPASKVACSGAACGRLLHNRLGMAGTSPAMTSHRLRPSASGRARKHLFRIQRVPRVGETGQNVIARQTGIVGENLRLAPTLAQETDDEFDRQARSRDHWLSRENLRIEGNGGSGGGRDGRSPNLSIILHPLRTWVDRCSAPSAQRACQPHVWTAPLGQGCF